MLDALNFLKLSGGFVFLWLGGELLVRGALGLSQASRIPPLVVAMTVVAMGTSAPELMVSAYSALAGHPSIAVGNVVGSNIANVLLVLGVPALIYPLSCAQPGLIRQTSLMIGVSLLFIVMAVFSPITFIEGLGLVALLGVFLAMSARGAGLMPVEDVGEALQRGPRLPAGYGAIGVCILLGSGALLLGARLVVEGVLGIAIAWGVSEAVIGLSLIALGTSLPELSITVIAAWHRSADVAIGNVIGSNLFNILAILGITALLTEIPVEARFLRLDVWVMLGASLLLWGFVLARAGIGRLWGLALLAGYFGYLHLLFRHCSAC